MGWGGVCVCGRGGGEGRGGRVGEGEGEILAPLPNPLLSITSGGVTQFWGGVMCCFPVICCSVLSGPKVVWAKSGKGQKWYGPKVLKTAGQKSTGPEVVFVAATQVWSGIVKATPWLVRSPCLVRWRSVTALQTAIQLGASDAVLAATPVCAQRYAMICPGSNAKT